MHDGCSGSFGSGQQVVDKVRMMGFAEQYLPIPMEINCKNCGESFQMITFEQKCEKCGMVHGVTPCHAHDPIAIQAAGIDY